VEGRAASAVFGTTSRDSSLDRPAAAPTGAAAFGDGEWTLTKVQRAADLRALLRFAESTLGLDDFDDVGRVLLSGVAELVAAEAVNRRARFQEVGAR
jgi:hypothetical protein